MLDGVSTSAGTPPPDVSPKASGRAAARCLSPEDAAPMPPDRPLQPLRLSPAQRAAAAFGPVLVVLVFGALAYRGAEREDEGRAAVDARHQVIEALQAAVMHAVDSETAQRGFLLTGRDDYLRAYGGGRAALDVELDSVRRLTAGDPSQQARLDSLEVALDNKFDELEETVALRRAGRATEALEVVAAGRGKAEMDRARRLADDMRRAEERELDGLEKAEASYSGRLIAILGIGTVVAAVLSLLMNGVLERYGRSQARFSAEVERANRLLEEQHAELEAQNEQLSAQSAELVVRTDAAEAANLAKARFLAAMSHDLRTPLNAIGGYVDLLEMGVRGPVNDAQASDLRRIRHSSRRLLAMINDILGFARIEAGHVEVRPEAVPLEAAVREMESSFLPQAAERGLEYAFVPGADGVRVHADPEKMQQVLLNLVTNAIKFTEPGGRVTLGYEAAGDAVLIHVRDTGRGIAPDKLPGIFEPFVQVDRERTDTAHQGVGLGLAISRELARAMGGELTAQSEPGAGSTFTLRLLRAHADSPLPRIESPR